MNFRQKMLYFLCLTLFVFPFRSVTALAQNGTIAQPLAPSFIGTPATTRFVVGESPNSPDFPEEIEKEYDEATNERLAVVNIPILTTDDQGQQIILHTMKYVFAYGATGADGGLGPNRVDQSFFPTLGFDQAAAERWSIENLQQVEHAIPLAGITTAESAKVWILIKENGSNGGCRLSSQSDTKIVVLPRSGVINTNPGDSSHRRSFMVVHELSHNSRHMLSLEGTTHAFYLGHHEEVPAQTLGAEWWRKQSSLLHPTQIAQIREDLSLRAQFVWGHENVDENIPGNTNRTAHQYVVYSTAQDLGIPMDEFLMRFQYALKALIANGKIGADTDGDVRFELVLEELTGKDVNIYDLWSRAIGKLMLPQPSTITPYDWGYQFLRDPAIKAQYPPIPAHPVYGYAKTFSEQIGFAYLQFSEIPTGQHRYVKAVDVRLWYIHATTNALTELPNYVDLAAYMPRIKDRLVIAVKASASAEGALLIDATAPSLSTIFLPVVKK